MNATEFAGALDEFCKAHGFSIRLGYDGYWETALVIESGGAGVSYWVDGDEIIRKRKEEDERAAAYHAAAENEIARMAEVKLAAMAAMVGANG